jgi:hypothetical protein
VESTFRTDTGEVMSRDVVERGVRHRAAMLGTPVERRMASWPWDWWQTPARLRRRGGPAPLVMIEGWDAVANRVLAARWLLLSGPFLLVGSVLLGIPSRATEVAGSLLLVLGAAMLVAALARQRRARRLRRDHQISPP